MTTESDGEAKVLVEREDDEVFVGTLVETPKHNIAIVQPEGTKSVDERRFVRITIPEGLEKMPASGRDAQALIHEHFQNPYDCLFVGVLLD